MRNDLTEKQIEYCRFRVTMEPLAAYEAAGYSMKTAVDWQVKTIEGNPLVRQKINEFAAASGAPLREWPEEVKPIREVRKDIKKARKIVKEAIEFAQVKPPAAGQPAAQKTRIAKVSKDELKQKLWDLHESAVAAKDWGTARQCLVDLGKDIGMFTPVQKIRVERIEDLSDEDIDALEKRFLSDAAASIPPVEQEDAGTPGQLVN